jgi:hypothetical protein
MRDEWDAREMRPLIWSPSAPFISSNTVIFPISAVQNELLIIAVAQV